MRQVNLGYPLIQLDSVDSTNTYASRLMRQETVAEGTVILAVHQTGGKGQGGSSWESDEGKNLLFSVILRPYFIRADKQFYLSMAVSTGIRDFLASLVKPVSIKWPNDVYIDARKVSGILIENTIMAQNLQTSIVGIGVNINQREFGRDLPNPTSLSLVTGREYELPEVLDKLLKFLTIRINKLYEGAYAEIRTVYLNDLWLINRWALYSDVTGQFEGRIADVAESGELVVVKKNGSIQQYTFKEITFPVQF